MERAFEVIGGGGVADREKKIEHLRELLKEYRCELEDRPRWGVEGKATRMSEDFMHGIRECEEDEFMAEKIARLFNDLGGKTEPVSIDWGEYRE